MEYVVIADGKVKMHLCSQGTPKVKLNKGEVLKPVKDGFYGNVGEEVKFFDEGMQRKSNSRLVQEGVVTLPPQMKLEGEEIKEKTDKEKWQEGLIDDAQYYESLGLKKKREDEISRISALLERHRNEKEMVKAGIIEETGISDEEYGRFLVLLKEWYDFTAANLDLESYEEPKLK